MKIVHIVGARPQFVKLAVVHKAISEYNQSSSKNYIDESIIHTGQHYDYKMSQIFFDELGLPYPDHFLHVGATSHAQMTGLILIRLDSILPKLKPDIVLVYGDTNSTLGAVLAASKFHIPIGHIEAGVRSYNRKMPEEINRVVADQLSTFRFCPTNNAIFNLAEENIIENVFFSGDVMYDFFLQSKEKINSSEILDQYQVKSKNFYLATIHRQENLPYIQPILDYFTVISSEEYPMLIPLHPRVRKIIKENGWEYPPYIKFISPVGYFDMLALESKAKIILTDSGGVQKEAYFSKIPCITVRRETEWLETVDAGWNFLSGTLSVISVFERVIKSTFVPYKTSLFGDGHAGQHIVKKVTELL